MRKPRIIIPGAWYHVTARTNRKELLLQSPLAKDMFVEILELTHQRFDFELASWVVMNNHFHLLLRPGDSPLAEIMSWLMGIYAMAWNRVNKQVGRMWGGRYFSRPVTTPEEFAHVQEYIRQNPVRAQLVEEVADWRWQGGQPLY